MPAALIRPATQADVRAIAEFQTRSWRTAYVGIVSQAYLDGMTVERREARWRRRLVEGEREIAVAVVDGEIVGVTSWSREPEDVAPDLELNTLYVDARHHGTGLARALAEQAIGSLPARVWVFERNARARAFYAKLGFTPDGASKIDEDTDVLELRLTRR